MVPSPRLAFLQVLEYLFQEDVNAGLKSLWNANQNANKWDCNLLLWIYCRKLFTYFIWQCPLLHQWLYATVGKRQKEYGLERYGQDNPSCPSGRQSHEIMWLSKAYQSMSSFLDLCFTLPSLQTKRGIGVDFLFNYQNNTWVSCMSL